MKHMRKYDEQRNSNVTPLRASRLETPSMTGFRPGMSSCSVIGRKLCAVYDVPANATSEIEGALETLDRRMAQASR